MNPRDVKTRILVQGVLELTSPAHLGGADPEAVSDRPLVRNGSGDPYLAGTTLAGLLRTVHPRPELFGANLGEGGGQARLLVSDAPILQPGCVPTEVRDGVAITPATGVSADRLKYDLELLPAGTRFELRLELLLAGDPEKAQQLRRHFLTLLVHLEEGQLRLGARSRRGFGTTRLEPARWTVTSYPVGTMDGLLAWVGRELVPEWQSVAPLKTTSSGLGKAWGVEPTTVKTLERPWGLKLHFRVDGSLLIRAPGKGALPADTAHLGRGQWTPDGRVEEVQAVVPGTTLGGVLRHRCLRIAQSLRPEAGAALVDGMFGSTTKPLRASRVEVGEARVAGGKLLRHARVRIDPWTGGAAEKLLFDADALYGGTFETTVSLWPGPGETREVEQALLLLAVRDLATGDLPVGGESNVGRGRLAPGGKDGQFAVLADQTAKVLLLAGDGLRAGTEAACRVVTDPPDAFDRLFEQLGEWIEEGT